MDVTPNQFLPFPEDLDPGNGALDLQVIAEAIDANITAKLSQFRTIINRVVRVSHMLVNGSSFGANQRVDILSGVNNFVDVYVSPGSLANADFDSFGLGTSPGIFHAGAFVVTNPVGAVNVGTGRLLEIQARIPNTPTRFPTQFTTKIADSQVFETNTGSEWQMAELEFLTPFPVADHGELGFTGTQISAFMTHRNTSSNLQCLAGSLIWIYRAADVEA
jgi:hypothetical protein